MFFVVVFSLDPEFDPRSHVAGSCPISLVSFRLEEFLSFFLVLTLMFLKSPD